MLLLLFLVVQNIFSFSSGCGITTHTVIGHRAASHYDVLFDGQSISAVCFMNMNTFKTLYFKEFRF